MRDKIRKIIVQAIAETKDLTSAIDSVVKICEKQYEKGWDDASKIAIEEVRKHTELKSN